MASESAIYNEPLGEYRFGTHEHRHQLTIYSHPRQIIPHATQVVIHNRLTEYIHDAGYIGDKVVHLEPECLDRVLIKGIFEDSALPGPRISSRKRRLPYVLVNFVPNELATRSWVVNQMNIDGDRCVALRKADQRHLATGGRMQPGERARGPVDLTQSIVRYVWGRHQPGAPHEEVPHNVRDLLRQVTDQHGEQHHHYEHIFRDLSFKNVVVNESQLPGAQREGDDRDVNEAMRMFHLAELQQRTLEISLTTEEGHVDQEAGNIGGDEGERGRREEDETVHTGRGRGESASQRRRRRRQRASAARRASESGSQLPEAPDEDA